MLLLPAHTLMLGYLCSVFRLQQLLCTPPELVQLGRQHGAVQTSHAVAHNGRHDLQLQRLISHPLRFQHHLHQAHTMQL